jgi:glycosyltransferase involved in cell wall biosynthesis
LSSSGQSPRVSVLLPVHNPDLGLFRDAVDSILRQTLSDFELIIVDDGSTNGLLCLLESLGKKDPRIRIFFRPWLGLVQALNFGLRHCRGPLIARMDADDLSRPDRLEKQADFLDKYQETGLVSGQVNYLGDSKKNYGYYLYACWINSLTSHETISLNRFIESPLAHPSVMFRKSLIDKLGSYIHGSFPEDYELWLRWLEQGVRMAKIPEIVLDWRDHCHRLSRVHPDYSFENFFKLKAGYLFSWLREHNPQHPRVWVWGAGRRTRQRAEHISEHGCEIVGYIDIRENLSGQFISNRIVRHCTDLPPVGGSFILVYVRKRGAREEIRAFLDARGRVEGRDYIVAA